MFIVGRAIAGMGGAGLSSGAMSIITMVSPPKERALWTGLFLGLFSVSFVVGPVIGGVLTQNVSWRWCFYMNLPAGAVTIGILLAFLHPPTTDKEPLPLGRRIGQLDLFGCFLFAGSIIMLFLAMQWGGNEYAWNSATVIGLFVGFGCTFIVFIYWQYSRGDDAMLPFSLMRRRSLSLSIIYCSFLGGASTVPVYYLPEWFQIIKGVGPTQSGIQMLPFVATQMLGMVMMGAICE
jgi:MFS family permease